MRTALVGAELEENLALRYIRASLERAGHTVVQIDFNGAADTEAAARALAASGASLAGLSMVFTYRARQFVEMATRARALGYRGYLVAGGHFAALNAAALLRDVPALDAVALGEGEAIMCDLAARCSDPGSVAGLVWRDADGELHHNPPAAKPLDLDALPWPTRRRPYDRYLDLPIVNVLQSRGCTHACAFCSIVAWHRFCGGPRYRARSVEGVADELAALYADGVRIFNFHDDDFLPAGRDAARARVRDLGAALRARGVGRIAFAIKARPDEVEEELFRELRELGLFRVFLGVEAGTAESLKRLGRGQGVDDNERALDVVNRLGLHTCFNLLLLNPDSTLEDLAANVAFLRRRPDNPMNFCRTEIYAGTPLERRLRRAGRLRGDYFGYDYRIADPRAETAFEVIYAAFSERNYGARCLHHRTMDVDYEHTLLGHFYGAGRDLTARVKGFVRRVNLDTCDRLDEIVAAVDGGLTAAAAARLAAAARARIRRADRRLGAEADRLLAEVRRCAAAAAPRRAPRSLSRVVAAAAGLAATVAVGAPGCKRPPTHMTEAVAAPLTPDAAAPAATQPADAGRAETAPARDGGAGLSDAGAALQQRRARLLEELSKSSHAFEMIASPPHALEEVLKPGTLGDRLGKAPGSIDGAKGAAPVPAKVQARLRTEFVRRALPGLASRMRAPRPLQVHLRLGAKGRVAQASVTIAGAAERALADYLRTLGFPGPGRDDRTFDLAFTAAEVRAARSEWPATHKHERIPRPPREPGMIHEMIPEPTPRK